MPGHPGLLRHAQYVCSCSSASSWNHHDPHCEEFHRCCTTQRLPCILCGAASPTRGYPMDSDNNTTHRSIQPGHILRPVLPHRSTDCHYPSQGYYCLEGARVIGLTVDRVMQAIMGWFNEVLSHLA